MEGTADGLPRGKASRVLTELTTAEIVTDCVKSTGSVVSACVTDVWPGAGCTVGGTSTGVVIDRTEPSLRTPDWAESDTTRPLASGPSSAIETVVGAPPITLEGDTATDRTDAGLMVSVAVALSLPEAPEISAC